MMNINTFSATVVFTVSN